MKPRFRRSEAWTRAFGRICASAGVACSLAVPLVGQDAEDEAIELPDFVLAESRVALDEPAESFPTVVSALRFEPRADLQTRNFGEAQGDISIRGGIFEGTAVQIDGLTIFDPQTGHYAAELPIPASMLGVPLVKTGVDHAVSGFNATAGSVDYSWKPIRNARRISAGFGSGSLNRQSLYVGQVLRDRPDGWGRIAVDGEFARSEGEGTIHDGDHDFHRVAGRIEATTGNSRTQLFAGYESKFFGWPNLYTPFGVAETENLQTTLISLAHRSRLEEVTLDAAGYFRRNRDDYEFDRYRPGIYNPYQHETRVAGGFASVSFPMLAWRATVRGEGAADSIESTSLTAGRFNSRSYWKLSAVATRTWLDDSGGDWEFKGGFALDDTNREASAVSPVVEVAWARPVAGGDAALRAYAQYSEATRVPGYTALNSSSAGGLFRGNPDLSRERAQNIESGLQWGSEDWSVHAAVFRRRDDPMVDWTFTAEAPNARSAREVAIDTWGFELVATRTWSRFRIIGGYTWLDKNADYFGADVDASFYALNFARHRVTCALIAQVGAGVEVRMDNELRWQEPNLLRTQGGDSTVLSSLGVFWIPRSFDKIELSLVADNLWKSRFEELPAVPSSGRQFTAGIVWHF